MKEQPAELIEEPSIDPCNQAKHFTPLKLADQQMLINSRTVQSSKNHFAPLKELSQFIRVSVFITTAKQE